MSETLNCRESSARFGSPRIASEIAAESTVSFPGDAGAGDRLTARGLAEGGDLGDDDLPGRVIDADVLPIVEGFSIDFRGEALGGDDADAAEALGGDDADAAEALGGDDADAAEASGGDDAAAAAAVTGAAASGLQGRRRARGRPSRAPNAPGFSSPAARSPPATAATSPPRSPSASATAATSGHPAVD